ncbi:MAG: hypothetical protein KGH88_06175 [Thaumarchaeota archaeon]|nr:hypothetical protein [Nitrososphaerota archaeon]
MKFKTINTFAVLVILMIVVPEAVGHSLFDKTHPANASVIADASLTEKISKNSDGLNCSLALEKDPLHANITRAAGLEDKYGSYSCV